MIVILAPIKGIEKVVTNMKNTTGITTVQFASNMFQAGKFLQKTSEELVPIDTGDLRKSAYTRLFKDGWFTNVVVGYAIEYAAYVHEDLDKAHGDRFNIKNAAEIAAGRSGYKMKRPDEQAKFLERPAREHTATILAIVMRGL